MPNGTWPDNEHELMRSFRKGNPKADKEIFAMFYQGLYNFAEKLTENTAESEDIVSEIFIKLYTSRSSFESLQKIKAFLFTCTRNACFNWLRSEGKVVSLSENDQVNDIPELISNQPEWAPYEVELLLKIKELVEANLPKRRKQIFKMAFYERKKQIDIAKQLGISEQSVSKHISKAIAKLKKIVPPAGFLIILYLLIY